MLKSKVILLIVIISGILYNSCIDYLHCISGNGNPATEIRQTNSFSDIENSTSVDVIFRKGDTNGVSIMADENLLKYVETEVYDNTLHIFTRNTNTCIDFNVKPLITVTAPNPGSVFNTGSGNCISEILSGSNIQIKMTGSGSIQADSVIADNLTLILSGSGNININESITSDTEIILTGSGNVNVSGSSDICKLTISGSGNVSSRNLYVRSADIIISGSGSAYTFIEEYLNAIISGSGNIYLKGSPAITQTITGSGRIIKH